MPEGLYSKKAWQSLLLKYLGASPKLKIIDFLMDNPLSDFKEKEVIEALGMSKQTFSRCWKELERSGAVKVTRRIGRATMYQLDRKNDVVKQLIKLDMTLARKAMEKAVEEYKKPVTVKSR